MAFTESYRIPCIVGWDIKPLVARQCSNAGLWLVVALAPGTCICPLGVVTHASVCPAQFSTSGQLLWPTNSKLLTFWHFRLPRQNCRSVVLCFNRWLSRPRPLVDVTYKWGAVTTLHWSIKSRLLVGGMLSVHKGRVKIKLLMPVLFTLSQTTCFEWWMI